MLGRSWGRGSPREAEVLGSQFMELQEELERLRGCPVVINSGKEMEELTLSVMSGS